MQIRQLASFDSVIATSTFKILIQSEKNYTFATYNENFIIRIMKTYFT